LEIRLVHCADWHAGARCWGSFGKGFDRSGEIRAGLGWLVELCREFKPHLVLLAGDLYDSPQAASHPDPSHLVSSAIDAMLAQAQAVVVSRGNHDPRYLSYHAKLLARGGVHVVAPTNRATSRAITFQVEGVPVRVCALPHLDSLSARLFVSAREGTSPEELSLLVRRRLKGELEGAFVGFEGARVLVGHLLVEGVVPCSSALLAREVALSPADLDGLGLSYVALGHVHRQMRLPSFEAPAFYSGSLVRLDFGEEGAGVGAVLVKLVPRGPSFVAEAELASNPHAKALLTLRWDGEGGEEGLRRALLSQLEGVRPPGYARLLSKVQLDRRKEEMAREVLSGRGFELVYSRGEGALQGLASEGRRRVDWRTSSVEELFDEFVSAGEFDEAERMKEHFRRLLAEVRDLPEGGLAP